MMGFSITYERYCGPQALAALAGVTPRAAAALLCDVARSRGRAPDYENTSSDELATAFVILGYDVELWSPVAPAGECVTPAAQHREQLLSPPRRRSDEDLSPEAREAVQRERERLAREPYPTPKPRRFLTVSEWLDVHPVGLWALHVGFSRDDGHVLAQADGQIVSGLDAPDGVSWLDHTLWVVYRIITEEDR